MSGFDPDGRRGRSAAIDQRSSAAGQGNAGATPGKTSLVDREYRESHDGGSAGRSIDSEAATDWVGIAQGGLQGSAQAVPHRDQIQRAFGRHDVSGVRAHVAGPAADASRTLGAQAYAVGNQVAFANAPDVETTAHELTHVVQQRAGVALRGGIDTGSDHYEQQANDIGAKVKRGASVEADLDAIAGMGASAAPAHAVVQRKSDAAPTTNPNYVNKYRAAILSAVADRILAVGVPQPHARLRWASEEKGAQVVSAAIREYVDAVPDLTLKRLMKLSHPADLFAIVDRARRAAGGVADVAAAVARALDVPITQSIDRMGTRFVAYRDAHGGASPTGSAVVASSPLDGVIADVLAHGENVLYSPSNHHGGFVADKRFADGAAEIGDFEYVGARDPNLWNWIHVKYPKNPTVEQVARTPFVGDHVSDGSEQAYRIAASPPYFGIPFETAKLVPEMFRHAPDDIKAKLSDGSPGPRVADDTVLAKSALADEAALAQAPPHQKTDESAQRTVERCHEQLDFLAAQLQRFKLDGKLVGSQQFVAQRRAAIANDPKEAHKWQSVLAMQERILHAVASEVTELLETMHLDASPGAAIDPVRRVLDVYVHAACVSHLGAQAPLALAKARDERALLPLALTEYKIQLAGRQVASESGSATAADDTSAYGDLSKRAADMRLKLARGGNVTAQEQDQLSLDADALATNARIGTLEASIGALMAEADAAGEPTASYEGGLPTVRALPNALAPKIAKWRDDVQRTMKADAHVLAIGGKRNTLASINAAITRFGKEAQLDKWREWAEAHIKDARWRKLINSILIEVGIMVLTGEIAGAVVSAFRGVALANNLITDVREASLLFKAGEVALQAGLNTASQGALGGSAGVKDFGENALGIVLGHALMKPFSALLSDSSQVETAVARSWRTYVKAGAKLAVEIPLETGTGIAAAALAHMAMHHGELSIASSDEWISQGLSIAASKFVHQRTQRMHERITKAIEDYGPTKYQTVKRRIDELLRRSALEQSSPEEALKQLVESEALLRDELSLYDGSGANLARASEKALDGTFLEVPLQLHGVSSVVDGHVYEGTQEQVDAAIATAEQLGIQVAVGHDVTNRVWHIAADVGGATPGKRTIEIHDVDRGHTNGGDKHAHGAAAEKPTTQHDRVAAQQHGTSSAHETGSPERSAPRPAATMAQALDGPSIASKLPHVTYEPGGTFRIAARHGVFEVAVRRTSGTAGHHQTGEHRFTVDVPKGLAGVEVERVILEQLQAVRLKTTWPGEIPEGLPEAQAAIFKQAKVEFDKYNQEPPGMLAGGLARVAWAEYLREHGIDVGGVRDGGAHEIHEPGANREIPNADAGVSKDPALSTRPPNARALTMKTCEAALADLLSGSTLLRGARHEGHVIHAPLANGRTWTITLVEPRATPPDQLAALEHGPHGDRVWVSDRLTDDQVARALGGVLSESIARAEHGANQPNAAGYGELDAMFVRLEAAERVATKRAKRPAAKEHRDPNEIKADAVEGSRAESGARIGAEIDLQLQRLGLLEPGAAREQQLRAMAERSPELAARVRDRLQSGGALGFRSEAVLQPGAVARPTSTTPSTMHASEVLPGAPDPAAIRPYGKTDYANVVELRVHLEAIAEIDTRLAHRDQAGTANPNPRKEPPEIALGESMRRREHVERVRELLADLQLGGGDLTYVQARLKELGAVFPGAERTIAPAIEERFERRKAAEAQHARAEAFRARMNERSEVNASVVKAGKPFTTKRLIVGDGIAGLSDLATLGIKTGPDGWIDPRELLVVGNLDLLARLDPRDMWGQRAGVFDRASDAHPVFADAQGKGNGSLIGAVEDPGEFVHAGEMHDAMDMARERLGLAAVRGTTVSVETAQNRRPGSPEWEVDPNKYPVRAKVIVGGEEHYVYSENTDITSGPGEARLPSEAILAANDRNGLLGSNHLVTGDQLLENPAVAKGAHVDVNGKRVLVLGFGPTGAWVAVDVINRGAARADWAGSGGGEQGTPSAPHAQMATTKNVDRVQNAISPNSQIHHTMDRVLKIEPAGTGAVVTYVNGHGENAEVYRVQYDVVVSAMGYSTSTNEPKVPGAEPTVKQMIGDMKMRPQQGTDAVALQDETGHMRVLGYAASEGTNVVMNRHAKADLDAADELRRRKAQLVEEHASADSPNDQVMETVGASIRAANEHRSEEER